jgi:hypothetical protein
MHAGKLGTDAAHSPAEKDSSSSSCSTAKLARHVTAPRIAAMISRLVQLDVELCSSIAARDAAAR